MDDDPSYEVVLKLFGAVSHFERGIVHSYARAVGDAFVLYGAQLYGFTAETV